MASPPTGAARMALGPDVEDRSVRVARPPTGAARTALGPDDEDRSVQVASPLTGAARMAQGPDEEIRSHFRVADLLTGNVQMAHGPGEARRRRQAGDFKFVRRSCNTPWSKMAPSLAPTDHPLPNRGRHFAHDENVGRHPKTSLEASLQVLKAR